MKKLLARFMISRSLDTGAPLSSYWRNYVSRSPELTQFEQAARAWDRRLKEAADTPETPAPTSLHASIMRAVRENRVSSPGAAKAESGWDPASVLNWGLATAVLLLVGAALWLAVDPSGRSSGQPNPILAGPAWPAVGPLAEQVTTNGIAALTLPLTRQMEGLTRDVHETAQFLLASLP